MKEYKKFAFPIRMFAEEEKELPSQIHVIPVGKWNHPAYGELKITARDIGEFVKNFQSGIRKEIPITEGHEEGDEKPAIGWFRELVDRGREGLFAVIEWTEKGKKLLNDGAYKYFSPEFYQEYEDPETRKVYKNVLAGGALTNKPYFKSLVNSFSEASINYQFNESAMELKDVITKDISALNDEEKQLLREKKDELNDEQKEKFKNVLEEEGTNEGDGEKSEEGADGGDGEGDGEKSESEEGEGDQNAGGEGDQNETKEKEVKGSERGSVVISAAEYKALEQKANHGHKAFAELRKMRIGNDVEKMVFSETNKKGKILPTKRGKVVAFMEGLNEAQQKEFAEIIEDIPQGRIFSEYGDGGVGGEAGPASEKLNKVVQKKMSEDKNLTYADAVKMVFNEDKTLQEDYEQEIGK